MAYLLLVLFLCVSLSFEELQYCNHTRTWFEVNFDSDCKLASGDGQVIGHEDLQPLTDDFVGDVWVGGYIQSSDWISIYGCFVAAPGNGARRFNITDDVYDNCMHQCQGHIAVHDNICFCANDVIVVDISCNMTLCPLFGTPEDPFGFCGQGSIKAHDKLYQCMCNYKKTSLNEIEAIAPGYGDCIAVSFSLAKSGLYKPALHSFTCSAKLNGVICTNLSAFYIRALELTWDEALEYCANYSMEAAVESILSMSSLRAQVGYYWLGIRRTTYTGWGSIPERAGDYNVACRSLNRTVDGHWLEKFVNCSQRLGSLCNVSEGVNNTGTVPGKRSGGQATDSKAVTIAIVVIVIFVCVISCVLLLCYLRRSGKWEKSPLELVRQRSTPSNQKAPKRTFANNFYASVFKQQSVIRTNEYDTTRGQQDQNVYDHLQENVPEPIVGGNEYDTMEGATSGYAHLEAQPSTFANQSSAGYDTLPAVRRDDATIYANAQKGGTGHYDTVKTFKRYEV